MQKPIRVYDARKDRRRAEVSQRTTLSTNGGLALIDGLLCYSPAWFEAVEAGRLQSTTIEGKISRVYMAGHGDFPEFEVTTEGKISTWERYGTESWLSALLNDRLYREGNGVRLVYVEHPWKPNQIGANVLGTNRKVVLSVDITPAA